MNNGVSIIIATRMVPLYLDECIKSIREQVVNFDYEIILGVDSCELTLSHINENKELYSGINVYSFEEHVGPYIIKNNLIDYTKYEYILFFDSDDIMKQGMLQTFYEVIPNTDRVNFNLINFKENIQNLINVELSFGVFGIKKEVFNRFIGFESWLCSADNEFKRRLEYHKIKYESINDISFYRRLHNLNLTVHPDTKMNSEIRSKNREIIYMKIKNNDWRNPEKIVKKNIQIK